MKTITFEDHGQDFLEWDIQNGLVINCRPFQAQVWVGTKIRGKLTVGAQPKVVYKGGGKGTIRYKVIAISGAKRKVVAA